MRLSLRKAWTLIVPLFVFAVVSLSLSGCSSEDDEVVVSDPTLGVWGPTSCARFFPDSEIYGAGKTYLTSGKLCDDPSLAGAGQATATTCVAMWRRYYYQDKWVFKTVDQVKKATSETVVPFPRTYHTRTVFYNTTTAASTCATADKFATEILEYDYVPKAPASKDTLKVSVENGFPDLSDSLNLTLVSAKRTYHSDTNSYFMTSINTAKVCEYSDWAINTEKTISDKDNCLNSQDSPNYPLTYYASYYHYSTYASLTGSWTAGYNVGTSVFSIFKVDDTATPKTIALGVSRTIDTASSGGSSRADVKTYTKTYGHDESLRQNTLGTALSYDETGTAAL